MGKLILKSIIRVIEISDPVFSTAKYQKIF